MKPDEKMTTCHTGEEKRTMGTAMVVGVDAKDPKVPLLKIKLGKAVKTTKTLAEIRAHKLVAESPLAQR
jgi:hypothetical protein